MNKIKILTIVNLMTICSFGLAQEASTDYRKNTYFGLKAGLNASNIYDSQDEDFNADARIGFVGGAVLNIPLGNYFGIQPEVLFSQKGFTGSGNFLGSTYTFTRTTSYIDIPLHITFKANELATFIAGPQFSYLINQKDVFDNSSSSFGYEEEFKNDNIRKNTLGFVAGMDLYLDGFVIGGRLGWDIQNNNGDGTSDTPRYKNVWLQGTIGYTLFKK